MKYGIATVCLLATLAAGAQTRIEKKVPVTKNTRLVMSFEDPELIQVTTWDGNEVQINGMASINNGENDAAFQLKVDQQANEVHIESFLKDKENIPKRIMIKKGETEYFFETSDQNDPQVQKFLEENGRSYQYMSHGIIKKITLEVKVPKNVETVIESKFGLVEVKNFQGSLTVNSKFGGVDASLSPRTTGELIAKTRFGEILTNLDISFDQNKKEFDHDHWTIVSAKPGAGPRYNFESKFGKVYLRKSEN